MRRKRPLRLATCCSGMEAPCFALQDMGQPFRLVLSCEKVPALQTFIRVHHHPQRMLDDVTSKAFLDAGGEADLMVAGFPCQPFSTQGKNEGEGDTKNRGTIVWYILQWLANHRPAAFVLENVSGLHARHPETLLNILRALLCIRAYDKSGPHYRVSWKIINSAHWVPQAGVLCVCSIKCLHVQFFPVCLHCAYGP